MALKTRDIDGKEILAVGRWRSVNAGIVDVTAEDLDAMVDAYQKTADIEQLPIKLGHNAAQIALFKDGLPSAGWLRNIRRRGDKLVADLKRVPAQIADLIEAGAWDPRSSEIGVQWPVGDAVFPKMIRGLALLGVVPPAVKGLTPIENLTAWYASEGMPEPHVQAGSSLIVLSGPAELADATSNALPDDIEAALEEGLVQMKAIHDRLMALASGRFNAPQVRAHFRAYTQDLSAIVRGRVVHHADGGNPMDPNEAGGQETATDTGAGAALSFETADAALTYIAAKLDLQPTDYAAIVAAVLGLVAADQAEDSADQGADESTEEGLTSMSEQTPAAALPAPAASMAPEVVKLSEQVTHLAEQNATLLKRVAAMEGQDATEKATAKVEALLHEGRLLPAQRGTVIQLAMSQPDVFDAWAKELPVIVKLGERGTSEAELLASIEPTEVEKATAQAAGLYGPDWRTSYMRMKAAQQGVTLPDNFGAK